MAEHLQPDLPNDQKDITVTQSKSDPIPEEEVKTFVKPDEEGKGLPIKEVGIPKEEMKKSESPKKTEEVVGKVNAPTSAASKKKSQKKPESIAKSGKRSQRTIEEVKSVKKSLKHG